MSRVGSDRERFTSAALTARTWDDLVTLAELPGSTILRRCWCVYYRCRGVDTSTAGAAANRERLRALVDAGRPAGILGYLDGEPVGYLSLGPREDYDVLTRSKTMAPVDDTPVWSILCTYVAPRRRGEGVQRQLLAAAIDLARAEGARMLEAYPVDKPGRSSNGSLWFGTRGLYAKAGFREVARRSETRLVMRRGLRPRRTAPSEAVTGSGS